MSYDLLAPPNENPTGDTHGARYLLNRWQGPGVTLTGSQVPGPHLVHQPAIGCNSGQRKDDHPGIVRGRPGRTLGTLRGDICLLYTSDAADEEDSVDLGGRRIIKKK